MYTYVYRITGEDARKRLNRRKEGLSVEYSGYWVAARKPWRVTP